MCICCASKDHHTTCDFIQAVDDPKVREIKFKLLREKCGVWVPAIGQNGYPGGLVNYENKLINVEN